MNRRAQIPTIILFVMAIILGVTTLYTMITFNGSFDSKSKEFTEIMIEAGFNKQYVMAQAELIFNESIEDCEGCSADVLKEKIKENALERERINRYEGGGNFYGKIRNDEFDIESEGESFKFEIPGLFVQSERGYNKIQKNFDLCLEADLEKNIVKCE